MTLRVAVIGTGHLGKIHARLLDQVAGAELVAVAEPLAAARDEAVRLHGVVGVADFHEIIGQIDAAIVAVPTRFHHHVGRELLNHGIHVLMEKPIATTSDQARELVDRARARRCVLQVGHVERFNPAFTAALPHVESPKYIEATRASGFTGRSTDIGVVLDLMIHDLDLVLTLANEPVVDIEAIGSTVFGPHEDIAQARLRFLSGCVANINASRVSPQMTRTMNVYCADRFVGLDFATGSAQVIRPSQQVADGLVDVTTMTADEKLHLRDNLFEEYLPVTQLESRPVNAILEEQRDFVSSIHHARPPTVTGDHGRSALEIAETIADQIASQREDASAWIIRPPHWIEESDPERKAG